MKTKILSLVLACLMLVSILVVPGVSYAADEISFKDVTNPNHWSYNNIMYVANKGIMVGVGDGTSFAPQMTMTRAQAVRALYSLAGAPAVKYSAAFSDVAAGKWYADAVIWAVEKNITAGAGNGQFAPDRELTRGELAMFMYKYAENVEYIDTTEKADIKTFGDYADVPSYFVDAMSWVNGKNIMIGVDGNKLAPGMKATREQFARIINMFDIGEYEYRLVYNAPVYGQNYVEPEYELVEDADIYVSTTGSDDAEGTKEDPIKTFAEAKARVRELIGSDDDEIKVAFFAGNYGSLDNLTFTSADSGTAEQPITYCAYGDGPVVFSNGIQIPKADFEPITSEEAEMFPEGARGDIYKADLNGKIDEITSDMILFGGKGPCDEARFPNKNEDGTDKVYKGFLRTHMTDVEPHERDSMEVMFPLTNEIAKFSTYEGLKATGHFRTGW
ncbi:MAG: S-layer homology domain-containing protein, partial [Ruminococcus sp.]|nr:S-layer homology domain-containing protein [Ruminococcus sp.]